MNGRLRRCQWRSMLPLDGTPLSPHALLRTKQNFDVFVYRLLPLR